MSRKPFIFSLLCILGLALFTLMTWINLPELEQYPIHWNAKGEADGFASKTGVFWVLMIIPINQIFITAVCWFIPSIEPLRENFEQSRSAYNIIWTVLMAFVTAAGVMIVLMYHDGGSILTEAPLKWVAGGLSLLFLFIGNVMGKVRQNFLLGIRTPWTLSSELSWEKTHRLGGRLFVITGVVGILMAILLPNIAVYFVITALLGVVAVSFVYSYLVWKDDPNKRQ
ncbi:SdpI family protein [Hellea sp.]|nr:SdpI family protein [Hellea sp.]